VKFLGTVDSATGTRNDFTILAGTGAITFDGAVGTPPSAGSFPTIDNLKLTGGTININALTQAMNVTMTSSGDLNIFNDIISPGFGTPGVNYGYHTFTGKITVSNGPRLIQGNIGIVNGTRVYDGIETVNGGLLRTKYNSDPTPAPPGPVTATVPDIPNLLNNQLNETQLQTNSPFSLSGSDSSVTSTTASQTRSSSTTQSDSDGQNDPDVCIKKDGCARQGG